MKKALSVLLSITVMCGIASFATAEEDIEKGILAIQATIEAVFGDSDFESMFEKDSFETAISESGWIVVSADVGWKIGDFAQGDPSTAEMISVVWNLFASASREYTATDVYFLVRYEGENIYLAAPIGVYDIRYAAVYEHKAP
jgi:hypothetical protein